jgi:hypothetical protein
LRGVKPFLTDAAELGLDVRDLVPGSQDPRLQFTGAPNFSAVLDGTGMWNATVDVPDDPALVGTSVYSQGYVFTFFPFPPNTLFFMTNTLTVTVVP